MILAKNLKPIFIRTSLVIWGIFGTGFVLYFLSTQDSRILYSCLLGLTCGNLGLYNMMQTVSKLAVSRKSGLFFPNFLFRLGLYGVPIAISLNWPASFNFSVVLISLFSFHAGFIGAEINRSRRRLKERTS